MIKRAYFNYGDEYLMFEELPAGSGYADIVYFPKRGSILPALIVELKWNQSADGAIAQIKNRRYPEAVKEYGGEILLVGISYNREAPAGERKHQCRYRTVYDSAGSFLRNFPEISSAWERLETEQ